MTNGFTVGRVLPYLMKLYSPFLLIGGTANPALLDLDYTESASGGVLTTGTLIGLYGMLIILLLFNVIYSIYGFDILCPPFKLYWVRI